MPVRGVRGAITVEKNSPQEILSATKELLAEVIARNPLRFMRSSSSSMPPQVISELEQVFGAIGSGGAFTVVGSTTSSPAEGTDLYLLNLKADGTKNWSRIIGGAGDETGTAVAFVSWITPPLVAA